MTWFISDCKSPVAAILSQSLHLPVRRVRTNPSGIRSKNWIVVALPAVEIGLASEVSMHRGLACSVLVLWRVRMCYEDI